MNEDVYQKNLKHEKRLLIIPSYVMPAIVLGLIILVFITTENVDDRLGISLFLSLIYPLVYSIMYLPKIKKQKNTNALQNYFKKFGYERVVIRTHLLNKLQRRSIELFIFTTAFVIIMMLLIWLMAEDSEVTMEDPEIILIQDFLYSVVILPGIMVYSSFLFRVSSSKHNDIGFYYSIGCFEIIKNSNSLSELEKTNYMILGLNYYDSYVRKNLKLRINNLTSIYSKIISDSGQSMKKKLDEIIEKLENGEKLDFLRYLADLLGTDSKSLLVSDRVSDKLKPWFTFVISVITTIVLVVQLGIVAR